LPQGSDTGQNDGDGIGQNQAEQKKIGDAPQGMTGILRHQKIIYIPAQPLSDYHLLPRLLSELWHSCIQ